NPIAHIDPVGTILLPVLLVISHSPVIFGWAKPVPINVRKFAKPKEGILLTALAGPFANIVVAALFAVFIKLRILPFAGLNYFFAHVVLINVVLAIFNLIPVPPLDGSSILIGILPDNLARSYAKLQPYGFLILLGLLYFGVIGRVIWPIVSFLTKFLIG
ncbi:site-2 protease family protein, partial [Candidatus Omnitrophota bacterium]